MAWACGLLQQAKVLPVRKALELGCLCMAAAKTAGDGDGTPRSGSGGGDDAASDRGQE